MGAFLGKWWPLLSTAAGGYSLLQALGEVEVAYQGLDRS